MPKSNRPNYLNPVENPCIKKLKIIILNINKKPLVDTTPYQKIVTFLMKIFITKNKIRFH